MIPHHQGALDMCKVLLDELTCTEWANIGNLDGMVHFCTHVRREQEWELAGMKKWLDEKGYPLEMSCSTDADHSMQNGHVNGHSDHSGHANGHSAHGVQSN